MNKRVAVAGASGMLGVTLSAFLRGQGWEVLGLSSRDLPGAVRVDYKDKEAFRATLNRLRPGILINLAANTSVDGCEKDMLAAYEGNVRPSEVLADFAATHGIRLVHVSTDQVYSGSGPHREDSVGPINAYALSKFAGELAAQKAKCLVLRTNFFGKSKIAGRIGFTDWIYSELSQGKVIKAFSDILFSPVSMQSLCRFIALAMESGNTGVFNLGARDGMSKAQFILTFAKKCGLDEKLITVCESATLALPAKRPNDMRMNCEKFMHEFHCKLPSIEDEINIAKGDYQ